MTKFNWIVKAVACLFCLPALVATAQSNFTGFGDGTTWNDAANWDNGVPSGVNANIGDSFSVTLSSNQTVNETDVVGDQNAGTATLIHTAGTLNNAGWMKVGHNADNDGTYIASGSAETNIAALFIASNGGTAMVDLSGNATINNTGGFNAGLFPTDLTDVTVNISNNAMMTATDFNLGQGTLNQSGGQVTASAWIAIGKDGGSGTYNISGGSVALSSDWFTVGETEGGALNVSGDAVVEAVGFGMLVGRLDGGVGTVEITGSDATISVNDLRVGLDGESLDTTGTATLSWIADADGISTIVSADNTEFGVDDSTLIVDLTAYSGADNELTLIDNAAAVSGTFAGLAEGASVNVGGTATATISYVGGDGNDIILTLGGGGLLGDVNCDGVVSLLDVQPFVALIQSGGFLDKADINSDGAVDLLDVGPFVDILIGG